MIGLAPVDSQNPAQSQDVGQDEGSDQRTEQHIPGNIYLSLFNTVAT